MAEEKEHNYVYAFAQSWNKDPEARKAEIKAQVEACKNTEGAFLKKPSFTSKRDGKEYKFSRYLWFIPKKSLEIADPGIKDMVIFDNYKDWAKGVDKITSGITNKMFDSIGTKFTKELGQQVREKYEAKRAEFAKQQRENLKQSRGLTENTEQKVEQKQEERRSYARH